MGWLQNSGSWGYSAGRSGTELATHEAGHAVLTHNAGFKVLSLAISPNTTRNSGGCTPDPSSTATPSKSNTYEDLKAYHVKLAAIHVAGVVAEFIGAGGAKPVPPFPGNLQPSDYAQLVEMYQRWIKVETLMNAYHKTSFTTTLQDFEIEASNHAFDVLTARWADAAAVSAALLATNTLGASVIGQLLP